MEKTDLISSGMILFAESMLWLWPVILLTAAFFVLRPSLRKTAPRAATITSTRFHDPEEVTPARPLSEALPARSYTGRALRPAD